MPAALLERDTLRRWINTDDLWHKWALVGVVILALALRLYRLDSQSFWIDEAWSISAASRNFPDFLLIRDNIPPLHHSILKLFITILGASEISARMPSVLAGVISVALLYRMAARLFGKPTGLVAAFLLSISPFHIWYSQEARPYAVLIMLSLASVWFLLDFRKRPSSGKIVGYVLTIALALYTHIYGLFLLMLQGCYILLLGSTYSEQRRKILLAQASAFLLFAPWLLYLFLGEQLPSAGFQKEANLSAFLYTFFVYSSGFSVGPSVVDLHMSRSFASLMPYMPILLTSAVVFAYAFVLGLRSLMVKRSDRRLLLLLCLFTPILGAFLITMLYGRITYNVRYTAIALPAYIVILAQGIASVDRKGMRVAFLALIVVLSAYSIGNYYFNEKYAKEDARSVAEMLETSAGERDAIVVLAIKSAVDYYYDGPAEIRGFSDIRPEMQVALYDELSHIREDRDKLWLVWSRPWNDPESLMKSYFDENHVELESHEFAGVQVYAYDAQRK